MDALASAATRRVARLPDAVRRARGVVHTPTEVARFMARRVADAPGTLVDPACGPGVFLAACLESHRPRRAVGVDLDAEALDDASAILEPRARAAGWSLDLRHGNTLAAPLVEAGPLVVIGNPPWAGRTANAGAAYTDGLLDDFKRDADGAPLRERKVGVLSDDYVRFLRWSCEQLRRPEGGAMALVTNSSFLDGPVHRGLRARLMRWFATIELVDLGGSALIARASRLEGSERDENVFGVRPGAVITIAVRPPGHDESTDAVVRYAALRGSRVEKLGRLARDELEHTTLARARPAVRFVPTVVTHPAYATWPSLPELMPFHREGLQTNRDAFCVDADREGLLERLAAFARGEPRAWPGRADEPSRHYDPEAAREALASALAGSDPVVRPVAYRPFDDRWVCVAPKICHRSRPDLLAAMDRSELALLTVRKDRGERPWAHFGASSRAVDNCFLSSRSSCRTRAFPTHRPDGTPNLDGDRVRAWAGFEVAPGDLLRYALAVLAAPTYRSRHDVALRADYPRLPPPPDRSAFDACVRAGEATRAAFEAPEDDGEPIVVGHRTVRSAALANAVRHCEVAYRALERH